MKPEFLLFDETGDGGKRSEALCKRIRAKGFSVKPAKPEATSPESIILCHSSDLTSSLLAILRLLSDSNTIVVIYTAGPVTSRDDNALRYRSLPELEKVLEWARPEWLKEDFAQALDLEFAKTRSLAFTTLAILAQCASAPVANHSVAKKRQELWRRDHRVWQEAMKEVQLGVFSSIAKMEGKTRAEALLVWIADGKITPDFGVAAIEAAELI